MLHSRARRADDRTREGKRGGGGKGWWWQCDLESDTELLAASGGSREMSIRFFGYFVGRRYLASCTSNWTFQISSRFFPLSRFSRPAFRLYLLTRASALVVFLTLLFGVSTSFTSPPPPPPPLPLPPAPSLLSLVLACCKRFYTRAKSRLSYLASLLGEDLSCGTLAASRRGCRSTQGKSVGNLAAGECCLISFDIIFNRDILNSSLETVHLISRLNMNLRGYLTRNFNDYEQRIRRHKRYLSSTIVIGNVTMVDIFLVWYVFHTW